MRIVAERRAHAKRREVIDGELIGFAGRENGRPGELPNDRRDCNLTVAHIALALHSQVLAITACQKYVIAAIQRHKGSGRPLDKG